jgi:predicted DNA-binding protein with PD1-like motif
MRHIQHPGNAAPDRLHSVPCRVEEFVTCLAPGQTLLNSVATAMREIGGVSAVMRLSGGALDCFAYCMPALSKTNEHAVYFSETYRVEGVVLLEAATVTVGVRAGQPWLHCHAVWTEPSGRRHSGHLLPDQVHVAREIKVTGRAIQDAEFVVTPDAETNFSLFMPQRSASASVSVQDKLPEAFSPAYVVRLAPNIDVCFALERFCREHGVTAATIEGGVGSTVGAVFEDGRVVEPFVTELLIRQGDIRLGDDGEPRARIDIVMVDYLGGVSEGVLARGENPVLVTFELIVQPLDASVCTERHAAELKT